MNFNLLLLQCGIGLNVRGCCKGFYCNIAPNDAYAYCDSLANPTCGKEGDIVSTHRT